MQDWIYSSCIYGHIGPDKNCGLPPMEKSEMMLMLIFLLKIYTNKSHLHKYVIINLIDDEHVRL